MADTGAVATNTTQKGYAYGLNGYEAMGPQNTDAKATSDALCEALQGWATALCNASRGRTMDDAIAALHKQHTRDGRPARYLPEA